MCDCRSNIEAALKKQHQDREPDATGHGARLEGYTSVLNLKTGVVSSHPGMSYKVTALHTAKTTGRKSLKSKKGTMSFNYCPFCGESLAALAASGGKEQG